MVALLEVLVTGELAHLQGLRAQIELRHIAGTSALLALGRFVLSHMQGMRLRLNLRTALNHLGAAEVNDSALTAERAQHADLLGWAKKLREGFVLGCQKRPTTDTLVTYDKR